jgi:hypothetical protein
MEKGVLMSTSITQQARTKGDDAMGVLPFFGLTTSGIESSKRGRGGWKGGRTAWIGQAYMQSFGNRDGGRERNCWGVVTGASMEDSMIGELDERQQRELDLGLD